VYAYHETRLGHSEHNYSVNAFSNYKLASYMDVYFCCTSMMIGHHKLPTSLLRQSYVVTPLLSIVGLWVFLSGTAKTLFFGSTPFLGEKCSRPSTNFFLAYIELCYMYTHMQTQNDGCQENNETWIMPTYTTAQISHFTLYTI